MQNTDSSLLCALKARSCFNYLPGTEVRKSFLQPCPIVENTDNCSTSSLFVAWKILSSHLPIYNRKTCIDVYIYKLSVSLENNRKSEFLKLYENICQGFSELRNDPFLASSSAWRNHFISINMFVPIYGLQNYMKFIQSTNINENFNFQWERIFITSFFCLK